MKEKLKNLCTDIWNVPNVLTMIRIALIPVFVVLYVNGQQKAALAVFLAASFTDYLDGYLARKLNQITAFGKLMDPLADKIMVLTAFLCPWRAALLCTGSQSPSQVQVEGLLFRSPAPSSTPAVLLEPLRAQSELQGCHPGLCPWVGAGPGCVFNDILGFGQLGSVCSTR